MATLDKEIETALKTHGLSMNAVWAHKQSGKYIMYHWACEHIAVKLGILFDPPTVVQGDGEKKIVALVVTGHMGEERTEWSIGEAAPYNTQQSYPYAMAEKRAKDRVILKLIGLHGKIYSEEEADDFKPTGNNEKFGGPLTKTELKTQMRGFAGELAACGDYDTLIPFLNSTQELQDQCMRDLPDWWYGSGDSEGAATAIENRKKVLAELDEQTSMMGAA